MAEERTLVLVTRRDAALIRAAASLAEFSEARRHSRHLAEPLHELADRIAAGFPAERVAA